jgi:hypothetical protein
MPANSAKEPIKLIANKDKLIYINRMWFRMHDNHRTPDELI